MLITETYIGCPQLPRSISLSCIANNAVVHRFAIDTFTVFGKSDGLAHHGLEGAPHGIARMDVYGGHGALRVGNEYFAVGGYRPYGGWREVHTGQSARPFPQLTSVSLVQGIQCIVPCAEDDLVFRHQRLGFDVALHAGVGPDYFSRMDVYGAESGITGTDVGGTVCDGHGSEYRFGSFYRPEQVAVFGIQSVDVAVSRPEYNDTFAYGRSTDNAFAGFKAP